MNFVPKSEEKQKQLPSVSIFLHPNSNEDQKTKKSKVFIPVCAIFIRLIEMKTKAKRFYLTILLLIVLLCDICFFLRDIGRHIRMKTKQIKKKRYFPLTLYGGTLNYRLGKAKFHWRDANYRWGDASLLQFKYWLYFHSQVMDLFIITIPQRREINISSC